jgi:hypothetical protein
LPLELQLKIQSIQNTNDALIEQTESYEKNLITESESSETKSKVNQIITELDEKIKMADDLIEQLDSGSLKEKEKLSKTKQDLNIKHNLEIIKGKIDLLPFNAKQVDFTENKQDKTKIGNEQKLGEVIIKETISFDQLFRFDFKELEISKSFTYQSRLFEILDNGNYVIGGFVTGTQKSHVLIYDPIRKEIIHELTLDNKIDNLLVFNNKIVFSQRLVEVEQVFFFQNYIYTNMIKIMDENLNLIRKTNTKANLKSLDESRLYCIHWKTQTFEIFDWNLNRMNTDFAFQHRDPQNSFYLKPARIDQFVKKDSKYILNFSTSTSTVHHPPSQLLIFNESGVLLKENKNINGDFVIDSNNNIIVNDAKNDLIYYYDFNGDLLKTVTYKRPKNFKAKIKQIKIDSVGNIYFGQ